MAFGFLSEFSISKMKRGLLKSAKKLIFVESLVNFRVNLKPGEVLSLEKMAFVAKVIHKFVKRSKLNLLARILIKGQHRSSF